MPKFATMPSGDSQARTSSAVLTAAYPISKRSGRSKRPPAARSPGSEERADQIERQEDGLAHGQYADRERAFGDRRPGRDDGPRQRDAGQVRQAVGQRHVRSTRQKAQDLSAARGSQLRAILLEHAVTTAGNPPGRGCQELSPCARTAETAARPCDAAGYCAAVAQHKIPYRRLWRKLMLEASAKYFVGQVTSAIRKPKRVRLHQHLVVEDEVVRVRVERERLEHAGARRRGSRCGTRRACCR